MGCEIKVKGIDKVFHSEEELNQHFIDNLSKFENILNVNADGSVDFDMHQPSTEEDASEIVAQYSENRDQLATEYQREKKRIEDRRSAMDNTWQDKLIGAKFSLASFARFSDKTFLEGKEGRAIKTRFGISEKETKTIDTWVEEQNETYPNLTTSDVIDFMLGSKEASSPILDSIRQRADSLGFKNIWHTKPSGKFSIVAGQSKSKFNKMTSIDMQDATTATANKAIESKEYNIDKALEFVKADLEKRNTEESKQMLDNWASIYEAAYRKLKSIYTIDEGESMPTRAFDTGNQSESKGKVTVPQRLVSVLSGIKTGVANKYSTDLSVDNTFSPSEIFARAKAYLAGGSYTVAGKLSALRSSGKDWANQLADKLEKASLQEQNLFNTELNNQRTKAQTVGLVASVKNGVQSFRAYVGMANRRGALDSIKKDFLLHINQITEVVGKKRFLKGGFVNLLDKVEKEVAKKIAVTKVRLTKEDYNRFLESELSEIPASDIQFALQRIGVNADLELCANPTFKSHAIEALDALESMFKDGIISTSQLTEKEFTVLAQDILRYNGKSMESSYPFGGKIWASTKRYNAISKFTNKLKSYDIVDGGVTSDYFEQLMTDPYTKTASFLEDLIVTGSYENEDGIVAFGPLKVNNKYVLDKTKIDALDDNLIFQSDANHKHVELQELTSEERLMHRITLFVAQRQPLIKDKDNFSTKDIVNFIMPTLSGANTFVSIKQWASNKIKLKNGQLTDESVHYLYRKLVLSEIERMKDNKEKLKTETREDEITRLKAGLFFFGFPSLNSLKYSGEKGEFNIVTDEGFIDMTNDKQRKEINELLYNEFYKQLQQAKKDCHENLTKNGLVDGTKIVSPELSSILEKTYGKQNTLTAFINDWVARNMLFNSDVTKTISFDFADVAAENLKALQKSFEGEGIESFIKTNVHLKYNARLKGILSPSSVSDVAGRETVTYVVATASKKFLKFSDGQEYCTLAEYALELFRHGKISDKLYSAISLETARNKSYSKESIIKACADFGCEKEFKAQILTPLKQLYFGFDINKGKRRFMFVKSSTEILTPWGHKGTELDKMRKYMESQGIDRFAFTTAAKLHNAETISVYNDKGQFTAPLGGQYEVSRENLGIQQETGYHNYSTRVTQLTKNAFDKMLDFTFNYKGNKMDGYKLRDIHNNLHNQLYKYHFDKLLNRIGGTYEGGILTISTKGKERLRKMFLDEALQRGYGNQTTDFLREEDMQALTFAPNSEKINYLISAIIRNNVLKYKMNGKDLVVTASNTLGEIDAKNSGFILTKAPNENGKVVFGDNEAIIPWPFDISYEQMQDMGMDVESIAKEACEIFSNRIPNQGPNSSAKISIIGFSQKSENRMIVSDNLVTQTGMDFDIDKLYSFFKNTYIHQGKILVVGDRNVKSEFKENYDKLTNAVKNNREMNAVQFLEEKIAKIKEKYDKLPGIKKNIPALVNTLESMIDDYKANLESYKKEANNLSERLDGSETVIEGEAEVKFDGVPTKVFANQVRKAINDPLLVEDIKKFDAKYDEIKQMLDEISKLENFITYQETQAEGLRKGAKADLSYIKTDFKTIESEMSKAITENGIDYRAVNEVIKKHGKFVIEEWLKSFNPESILQNQLVDVYLSIHSSPQARSVIESPLEYGGMDTFAEKIRPLIASSNFNVLTAEHNDANIGNGAGQKKAVGVFAILGSLSSILTGGKGIFVRMKGDPKVTIGSLSYDGNVFREVESSDKIKDVLSVALDDAKMNIGYLMGISEDKFKALTYLLAVNMPMEERALFLSHPAIAQYLKLREKLNRGEAMRTFRESLDEYDPNAIYSGSVLTREQIENDIKNGLTNIESWIAAVQEFDKAERFGEKISSLTKFVSIDSKGAPVNFIESIMLENEYNRIMGTDSEYEGLHEVFGNSVIENNVHYGLSMHNALLSNFNFLNTGFVKKLLTGLKNYTDFKTNEEDVTKSFVDGVKLYIMQHSSVFGSDFNTARESSKSVIKHLFIEALDNKNHELNEVAPNLMRALKLNIDEAGNLISVTVKKGIESTETFDDAIARDILDMAKTDTGKALAEALVDYAITHGTIYDYNSPYRFMPYAYLLNNKRYNSYKAVTEGSGFVLDNIMNEGTDLEMLFALNNFDYLIEAKGEKIDDNTYMMGYGFKGKTYVTVKEAGVKSLFISTGTKKVTEKKNGKDRMVTKYMYSRVMHSERSNNYHSSEALNHVSTGETIATELESLKLGGGVKEVIDNLINSKNINPLYKALLKGYLKIPLLDKITIETSNVIGKKGEYKDGKILINAANIKSINDLHVTIIHEINHALTVWAEKSTNKAVQGYFKSLKESFYRLQEIKAEEVGGIEAFNAIKEKYDSGKTLTQSEIDLLAYSDFHEFIGRLSEEYLIQELAAIPSEKKQSFKQSILNVIKEFTNLVKSIFRNEGVKTSMLDDVIADIVSMASLYNNESLEGTESSVVADVNSQVEELLKLHGHTFEQGKANEVKGDIKEIIRQIININSNTNSDMRATIWQDTNGKYFVNTKKTVDLKSRMELISDEMLKVYREC